MATKAKRFRICVEGATTDGRAITREWITQMASGYDPKVYGARVNLEHIKSVLPESSFRAYGDVTACYAEEITEGALAGKLALYAEIDPTPDLVAMNKARQKVYTSIEVNPKFANTGAAYLVGLAVTDSPASLGTEYLKFSANAEQNPLANRKLSPENLFTAAEETLIEFEEIETRPSLVERIKQTFSRKQMSDDARFAEVHDAVTEVAEHAQTGFEAQDVKLSQLETTLSARLDSLEKSSAKDGQEFAELKNKLATTESTHFALRPIASGSTGKDAVVTDC